MIRVNLECFELGMVICGLGVNIILMQKICALDLTTRTMKVRQSKSTIVFIYGWLTQ